MKAKTSAYRAIHVRRELRGRSQSAIWPRFVLAVSVSS